MAFTTGQKLQDGKYTIDRLLNEGRFGISYLAHDKQNQRVVIKTFRDDTWQHLSTNERGKENNRLLREGGELGQFDHPHIVKFHRPFLEQGQACLVMEYIDGQDLASIAVQKLPVNIALEYIRQIGSALQEIHLKRKVHRDVKPGNIMLRAGKPEVVLIDFGLASVINETITMNENTREKGFTAPELYDPHEKAQPYSDVYSLGATLYALLSGQAPPSVQERSRIGKSKLPALPSTVDKGIYEAIAEPWN
ncbi:MAG: serine/threonine protein kinase [Coleofasciculaceae cyanobacterium SM2_1_6]|nr:serine/threonine protein kinase [Coleofasciculaceae cyanobacterium SM2_1_6]